MRTDMKRQNFAQVAEKEKHTDTRDSMSRNAWVGILDNDKTVCFCYALTNLVNTVCQTLLFITASLISYYIKCHG